MRDELQAGSLAVGDAWVARVRRDLRKDNRAPAGGWPGTMREARAVTYAHFTADDTRQRYGTLSAAEFESVARAAYDHARKEWLRCASADEEEGDS